MLWVCFEHLQYKQLLLIQAFKTVITHLPSMYFRFLIFAMSCHFCFFFFFFFVSTSFLLYCVIFFTNLHVIRDSRPNGAPATRQRCICGVAKVLQSRSSAAAATPASQSWLPLRAPLNSPSLSGNARRIFNE